MSNTWTLGFGSYKTTDDIFDKIVSGEKTIETRPATKDFKVGDKLILESIESKRVIEKEISFINKYDSPEEMLDEDFNKILPDIGSKENLLKVYEEVKINWGKKYKDDLEKFEIVAIGIK